jgi:hypothetical protein
VVGRPLAERGLRQLDADLLLGSLGEKVKGDPDGYLFRPGEKKVVLIVVNIGQ